MSNKKCTSFQKRSVAWSTKKTSTKVCNRFLYR